jgi:hypothetical protein
MARLMAGLLRHRQLEHHNDHSPSRNRIIRLRSAQTSAAMHLEGIVCLTV